MRRFSSAEAVRSIVDRSALNKVITGTATLADLAADNQAKSEGDESAVHDFVDLLDEFQFWFNILTP